MQLDAITFDYWDTIMVSRLKDAHRTRLAACLTVFENARQDVSASALDEALRAGWRSYHESWHANRQFGPVELAVCCLETLGLPTTGDFRNALVDAIIADGAQHELQTTPNIGAALEQLRSAGLRIGIICDVAITTSVHLREQLDRAGLLGYFDHWSFSDEVGYFKPAPEIFAHAAAGLGVDDPARIAHVGDLKRTDVAGARAAGWRSVRYAGITDDEADGPDADHVVHDHSELVRLIEDSSHETVDP